MLLGHGKECVSLLMGDGEGGRGGGRRCCGDVVGKFVRGHILDHYAERGMPWRFFVYIQYVK